MAGIKVDDLISKIDGNPVTNAALNAYLKDKKPGDTIRLTVLHKGDAQPCTVDMALGMVPKDDAVTPPVNNKGQPVPAKPSSVRRYG